MRTLVVFALLLMAALAGCANGGGAGDQPTTEEPAAFEEVEVTQTTGAIRGVVVNDAIVPIEGVRVAITNGPNRTTDADGAFVFNGLEPGDYFLTASKLGYNAVQQAVSVAPGSEPPVTKILLVANPNEQPYTTQQVWDGFIQCGFMVGYGVFGAQACGPLDGRFIHYFAMDVMPTHVQAEAVWQSTQALGNDLSFSYYDGGTWHFKQINGVSPLILNATGEDIVDWWGENETELPMRMFPGSAEVSVTVNQQFTAYMTMFYNFTPRQGWAFIVDGACGLPEQCT